MAFFAETELDVARNGNNRIGGGHDIVVHLDRAFGYLALGFADEAQTAAAILGYNYQSSPFYEDSFRLLKGQGLVPEAKGSNWLSTIYRQMIKGEWL